MKSKDALLSSEVLEVSAALWPYVKRHADVGVACPCCGQLVRRYRRRLHAEMARFLYRLYQADRDEPGRLFHVRVLNPATAKASTDAAYLVHWDLVMKDGRGSYAITAKGRAFCQGSIRVPECLVLLCGEFECLDGLLISIEDALGQSIGELKL